MIISRGGVALLILKKKFVKETSQSVSLASEMDSSAADLHLDLKRESIGERDSRRNSVSEKAEQRPSNTKTRLPVILADDEAEPIDLAPPSPPIPSFRKMLFPIEPVTATTVNFSPRLEMAALKKSKEGRAAEEARKMSAPASRTKTKYELFREKRYMKNYKSSLSGMYIRRDVGIALSQTSNINDYRFTKKARKKQD